MAIEDYLQGLFEYGFSALNIQSTLEGRGLTLGTPFTDIDEKDIDLAQSDLYMILASVGNGRGARVQKGNRSVSNKSYLFAPSDRQYFRGRATLLRRKWGEQTESVSSVRFANMFER